MDKNLNMKANMLRIRINLGVAIASAMAMLSGGAVAQSSNRGMMIIGDNDNNEHIISYAEPNIELITQPFVNRRDLPLFVEYLALSEAQANAVQRLIDKYLEDFQALLREKHPQPQGPRFGMREIPADAAEGDAKDKEPQGAVADAGDAPRVMEGGDVDGGAAGPGDAVSDVDAILLDEIRKEGININSLDDLPVEPMIGIGISIGRLGEDGEPEALPEPEVSVSVGFGSEDDTLDEGMRAKLEAAAKRAVPRMTEAVKKQQMVQMAAGEGLGRSGLPPAEEIEHRFQELEALRARVDAFIKAKNALLNSLFANIKKLLAEDQLPRWPAVERALTRVKTLPWGELDGEQVDLIVVAKEFPLSDDERAAVSRALNEYETRLHELLTRRNELLETVDAEIDRALHDRQYEKALTAADRLGRARIAVRDLNDQTIEKLQASLDEMPGRRLRAAALAEAYPRIWRQTIGQQAFDEALLLEGLDPDLQMVVLEQARVHAQLMGEINDRIWQAVRREQADRLKTDLESTVARYKGEETPELDEQRRDIQRNIRDAFQQRQDLDVRSMKNLYASLPAEVVANLPEIPKHEVGTPVKAQHTEGGARIILDEEE